MPRFSVIYDSNVIVPAPLRDLLLRVAESGLVRGHLSDGILGEVERVLIERFQVPKEKAARLRFHLDRALDDGVVREHQYSSLPIVGLPDKDDEHVVAAARAVGAQAIVTSNLKDFPSHILAPLGIEALHPDEFLLDLIDLYPVKIVRTIEAQAAALRHPPKSFEEVLDALARSIPESVGKLRES